MPPISYKDIMKNSRLTDFNDFRNSVVNYNRAVRMLNSSTNPKVQETNLMLKDFLR